ncbi:MAG: hypothetical protein JW966_10455 [Anaerolineae bacterium]|nr:hypothetical protein [Anaerolineae bacterium]
MNGNASVISIAQKTYGNVRKGWRNILFLAAALVVVGSLSVGRFVMTSRTAAAAGDEARSVFEMVRQGDGQAAVALVADIALARGGWAPAPGDTVAFDANLAWNIRGEVMVRDRVPSECDNPRLARTMGDVCGMDLVSKQSLVRFGATMFSDPQPDGSMAARPTFDDVLSTYIEEVGHSWQEYQFETEGLGDGPRTHLTGWEEVSAMRAGWEYQIKRYILSLDGTLLTLSELERGRLLGNICDEDGYANPLGHQVMPYGAPANWPNPEGWPVTDPTLEEWQALCAQR